MTEALSLKPPRKQQIRPPVEAAIQLIVTRGITIADAAQSVGMRAKSLAIALRKSHVSTRLASVKREWLESKVLKAWVTVADLAEGAASEDARLRASKVILEAAGELTPRDQGPRPSGVMVQIVVGDDQRREVRISDGASNGVIEAEPYSPPPRLLPAEGDDD